MDTGNTIFQKSILIDNPELFYREILISRVIVVVMTLRIMRNRNGCTYLTCSRLVRCLKCLWGLQICQKSVKSLSFLLLTQPNYHFGCYQRESAVRNLGQLVHMKL